MDYTYVSLILLAVVFFSMTFGYMIGLDAMYKEVLTYRKERDTWRQRAGEAESAMIQAKYRSSLTKAAASLGMPIEPFNPFEANRKAQSAHSIGQLAREKLDQEDEKA